MHHKSGSVNTKDRGIRVRKEKAESLCAILKNAGFDAKWRDGCYTNLGNGCSDPECCEQHISYLEQEKWATIITNASGNQAHKIWVASGLTSKFFGK